MLRKLLSVIIGVILGSVFVFLIQKLNTSLYPFPEDINPLDKEAIMDHIRSLPSLAFLISILSHAVGSFVAAFAAARISPDTKPLVGIVALVIMFFATVTGAFIVPQPAWVTVTDILGVGLFGYLGVRLGSM